MNRSTLTVVCRHCGRPIIPNCWVLSSIYIWVHDDGTIFGQDNHYAEPATNVVTMKRREDEWL